MKTPSTWILLGTLFPALLWMISCSSTPTTVPTPSSTPTPTPSPRQVIDKSAEAMLALKTASFALEHAGGGSVEFFPGIEWQRLEGQVEMPDSFEIRVEATSAFPRSFIELHVVAVGDEVYVRDIINKEKWYPIPVHELPFNFVNLGRTLGYMIQSVQNPTFTGTEKVDGVLSWRVRGTVPSESLAALVPVADPGYEIRVEGWIGQAQGLLRKVTIGGQIVSSDLPDAVRVLTLYGFDETVEVSLPEISD